MPVVEIKLNKLHAGQQKVIDEAARFNVLECGRRFGKTTLGTDLAINTAIDGRRAGWGAPTYKYLAEVWRECLPAVGPILSAVNVQEKRIELVTGGVIEFWSLDDPNAGRGRKYHRFIIDEAGIVRDLQQVWQQAIRPTLTDYKGDAWLLGTPKGNSYFHRLFARGEAREPGWRSWRLPTIANPTIDPAEIEAARQDMPESAFNQEFLGIPADDGGNPFGLSAIRLCVDAERSTAPAVCFGIDLAKSQDWTVVCGLDAAGRVCVLERWQSDWGQTMRRVLDLIGRTPATADATGVGDPIVEQLQRGGGRVDAFKFSSTSKQQLMEGLAAAIQRQQVRFPGGWLVGELESFEYEYRPGGVRYSAPAGLHDDGVCALALAVHQHQRPRVTLPDARRCVAVG